MSLISTRQLSRSTVVRRKMFTVEDSHSFMEKVLNNDVPVIVNFHAEWCEPCKLLTPKLEELIVPMPGVDLAVVDVETCPDLVHAFEVKAVPAVIAVRSGLVVDKFVGLIDARVIENFIKRLAHRSKDETSDSTATTESNT
jgi:thioredoxin 1